MMIILRPIRFRPYERDAMDVIDLKGLYAEAKKRMDGVARTRAA